MFSQVIDKPGEDKNTKGMSIAVVSLIYTHMYTSSSFPEQVVPTIV